MTAELYRGLGRNAARYAKGAPVEPLLLPESSEPLGPRYHARVVQLVATERRCSSAGDPVERRGHVADLTYPLARSGAARRSRRRPAASWPRSRSSECVGRRDRGRGRAREPGDAAPAGGLRRAGGNRQLAENLRRGAELAAFSDDELLAFYEKLRPGRSTATELDELGARLDDRGATRCAALVREAVAAYVRRGLIR